MFDWILNKPLFLTKFQSRLIERPEVNDQSRIYSPVKHLRWRK